MAYCSAVAAVSTAANVNISSPGFSSLDGVSLSSGISRILLTGQTTTPHQNGVWIWNGSTSALTRPATGDPFHSGVTLDNATVVPVAAGGATWGGSTWWVNTPATGVITVDTTSITLVRQNTAPIQARLATTANISLTAPGTTIDGVTPNAGDVVLVCAQTTASANGVYTYQSSASAMTRTADPIYPNLEVLASEGTDNAHTLWTLITPAPITVGTTSLSFSQHFATQGTVSLTNGLNSNVATGGQSSIRFGGYTGAVILGGLAPPTAPTGGQGFDLSFTVGGPSVTIRNLDASSSPGNQIFTGTGGDVLLPPGLN